MPADEVATLMIKAARLGIITSSSIHQMSASTPDASVEWRFMHDMLARAVCDTVEDKGAVFLVIAMRFIKTAPIDDMPSARLKLVALIGMYALDEGERPPKELQQQFARAAFHSACDAVRL